MKFHCTLFTEKVSTVLFQAPLPVLEKFRRIFYPDSTDCPWVSEDENNAAFIWECLGRDVSLGPWNL